MNKRIPLYMVIPLVLLASLTALSQIGHRGIRPQGRQQNTQRISLYQWFMPDSSLERYQLTLYLNLANDFLNFIQSDTGFVAQYELNVNILNKEDESIAGQILKKTIYAASFNEANSIRQINTEKLTFSVAPGEWSIFIEIMDAAASTPHRESRKLILPAIKPLMLTAPIFVRTIQDSLPIEPLFPPVIEQYDAAMETRFLITAPPGSEPVKLFCAIVTSKGDTVKTYKQLLNMRQSRQWLRLPLEDNLDFGEYTLNVTAKHNHILARSKTRFWIRWGNHSQYMPELTDAAEALKYIMNKNEYKELLHMQGDEQKEALNHFWKERDPTPDTALNELEEEYYKRVEFANLNFSPWNRKLPGWKSSRGRVYILYGPPTQIEKPPLSSGSQRQYEIWHYQTLNRKFLFVDRYGNGDYILYSEE